MYVSHVRCATGVGKLAETWETVAERVRAGARETACYDCRARLGETYRVCFDCRRSRCQSCDGNGAFWICNLSRCRGCKAASAGLGDLISSLTQHLKRLKLQKLEDELVDESVRDGTVAVHVRGLHSYLEHATALGIAEPLPATPDQIAHYAVWSVLWREVVLDVSTVKTYLSGVSVWHQQAMEASGYRGITNPRHSPRVVQVVTALEKLYKKESSAKVPFTADRFVQILHLGFLQNTFGVRHNELLFVLLAAGPFRPNAATNIVARYAVVFEGGKYEVQWHEDSEIWVDRLHTEAGISVRLHKDKNVTKKNSRVVVIPEQFFGLNLIELLESYILEVRPPSGGRLLASPKDLKGSVPDNTALYLGPGQYNLCNTGAYTATCEAVRRAARRAADELGESWEPVDIYGGGSPRKATADLLYASGHTKKMVADVGVGCCVRMQQICTCELMKLQGARFWVP